MCAAKRALGVCVHLLVCVSPLLKKKKKRKKRRKREKDGAKIGTIISFGLFPPSASQHRKSDFSGLSVLATYIYLSRSHTHSLSRLLELSQDGLALNKWKNCSVGRRKYGMLPQFLQRHLAGSDAPKTLRRVVHQSHQGVPSNVTVCCFTYMDLLKSAGQTLIGAIKCHAKPLSWKRRWFKRGHHQFLGDKNASLRPSD